MIKCFLKSTLATVFSIAILLPTAQATLITSTLGTFPTGLTNGQILTIVDLIGKPDFGAGGNGSDPISNFDRSWTHSFGPISGTIQSASITLGIYDHDSAHIDSQLATFMLDGTDFTTGLNTLFESSGGTNNEYNVYSISLPTTFFTSLLDGSMNSNLALKGPVASPGLLPTFPDVIQNFNGAKLIFSKLEIDFQTSGGNTPVPEPNTIFLFLVGLILIAIRNYFVKKV